MKPRVGIFLMLLCLCQTAMAEDPPRRLTYLEACRLAIERSPTVHKAFANLEVALGGRTVARRFALPKLDIQSSGGLQGDRGEQEQRPYGVLLANFEQPLLDLRIPYSFQAGDLEVAIAVHNYWATVNATMYLVRSSYVTANYIRASAANQNLYTRVNEGIVTNLSSFEASGLMLQTSLIRANLVLARSRVLAESIPANEKIALLELASLMGFELPPDSRWLDEVSLVDDFLLLKGPANLQPLIANAKKQRPDIRIRRAVSDRFGALSMVAFGEMLPVLNFEANLQSIPQETTSDESALLNSATGTTGIASVPTTAQVIQNEVQNTLRYGPALTWKAFDGFAAVGNSRSMRAAQRGAMVEAEELAARLEIDSRILEATLRSSRKRMDLAAQNLSVAQATSSAAGAALLLPDANLAEVQFAVSLDETQALLLRTTELDARFVHAMALARLDFVLGRNLNLEFLDPPATPRDVGP